MLNVEGWELRVEGLVLKVLSDVGFFGPGLGDLGDVQFMI